MATDPALKIGYFCNTCLFGARLEGALQETDVLSASFDYIEKVLEDFRRFQKLVADTLETLAVIETY